MASRSKPTSARTWPPGCSGWRCMRQDEWDWSKQFSFYLGARWEAIDTRSDALPGQPQVANRSAVFAPLAHMVWKFPDAPRDQLRLSLTRSYRSPNLNQLIARRSTAADYDDTSQPNIATKPDRAGQPRAQARAGLGPGAGLRTLPGRRRRAQRQRLPAPHRRPDPHRAQHCAGAAAGRQRAALRGPAAERGQCRRRRAGAGSQGPPGRPVGRRAGRRAGHQPARQCQPDVEPRGRRGRAPTTGSKASRPGPPTWVPTGLSRACR